jgi:hypothetical protein
MSGYTICYDNKLNKVYLKKNSNETNNHIPYDSYDSNALADLNTQLNNIYESNKNEFNKHEFNKNEFNKHESNNYKKNNNELVEVDSSLFFEKFKHQRGPKGEKGEQGLQGLRGFPGPAGKDGVCNCGDIKNLLNRIDTLEKIVIELSKKNMNPVKKPENNIPPAIIENNNSISSSTNYIDNILNNNPKIISENNKIPTNYIDNLVNNNSVNNNYVNNNSVNNNLINNNKNKINNKKKLIYAFKTTHNEERNFKNLHSNNDIKLTFRNKRTLLYDTFYLYDDTNNLMTNYSLENMNIDIFTNKDDYNDIQYFPTNAINIYGNVIKLKKNGLNIIKLKNIVCNIKQSINNNTNNIVGIMYNTNKIIEKNLSLFIFFELHTKINNEGYKDMEYLFPYYNNKYKQTSPNNTCLNSVKRIKINKINNNFDVDDELEISFFNQLNLDEILLYIRIGLTKKNEEELFGTDINNNQIYGYIPINEFNISFDYDVV